MRDGEELQLTTLESISSSEGLTLENGQVFQALYPQDDDMHSLEFYLSRYAIWKMVLAVNLVLRNSFCLICIAIMTTTPVRITVQGGQELFTL